jgi:PAS domain S-box-containing protein
VEWAEPVARTAGALASLARRFSAEEEESVWLSPRLAGATAPAVIEPLTLADPRVHEAIERRISLVAPALSPLGFVREQLRTVAVLGFPELGGAPAAVVWLGYEGEPNADQLEGLWAVLERSAETEHRYRRFFDQLPMVLISVGLDGVVHECNDRISSLGYDRAEVVGASAAPFFLPGERDRLRSALSSGAVTRRETAMRHRSGEVVLVDMACGLVRNTAGEPVEIVAAGRDLREERRLEHDRRMEAVGRMISGVAHELNNPLLTVLGNAEMLAEAKLSGPARRRAERVLSGARRCQDVVDELLRLRLRPKELDQEVDLEAVMVRALSSVRGELEPGPPAPQVDLRIPPALAPVRGDARDLEQALAHILRNAFQAVVGLPEGRISVTVTATEGSIQLVVQDNGPGMTSEAIEHAFEPFYTTREIGKGRGLGLPIALGIVHDHGGNLELRGEPPGLRVQLTLPTQSY